MNVEAFRNRILRMHHDGGGPWQLGVEQERAEFEKILADFFAQQGVPVCLVEVVMEDVKAVSRSGVLDRDEVEGWVLGVHSKAISVARRMLATFRDEGGPRPTLEHLMECYVPRKHWDDFYRCVRGFVAYSRHVAEDEQKDFVRSIRQALAKADIGPMSSGAAEVQRIRKAFRVLPPVWHEGLNYVIRECSFPPAGRGDSQVARMRVGALCNLATCFSWAVQFN